MTQAAEPTTQVQRRARLWQVLAVILAVFVIEQDVEVLLGDLGLFPGAGSLGAHFHPDSHSAPGYVQAGQVTPDGAMARAGVKAGDRVRFDRVYDRVRALREGEVVGFTLGQGETATHATVTATAKRASDFSFIYFDVMSLFPALLGAFLVSRAARRTTTRLLGVGILAYGLGSFIPGPLLSGPDLFSWALTLTAQDFAVQTFVFPLFAIGFYRRTVGAPSPWATRAVIALGGLSILACLYLSACTLMGFRLPILGGGADSVTLLLYAAFALAFYYMYKGWRLSAHEDRKRYGVMLIALSFIILAQAVQSASFLAGVGNFVPGLAVEITQLLAGIVAPVLFAYAILRHKVLDLDFALNRTLVYTAVTSILLIAFGLIEWAVDHLVKIEGREGNAFIDAAIAVAVFLTFHRIRDMVEAVIERLFFNSWHRKAAALSRFVREAAFFTKPEALSAAFLTALGKFGEGAGAALYLKTAAGDYGCADGAVAGAPAMLDPDDPILVSLRADPKPLELDGGALVVAPGGGLVLPMLNRNEVTGFVLMGLKPSGAGYRPDEVEALAHAATQIGLDLNTLKIESLEALASEQRNTIAVLQAREDAFTAMLPSAVSA